jgi:GTP cyclohydrolase I
LSKSLRDVVAEFMEIAERDYNWKFTDEEKANTPDRVVRMFEEWKQRYEYSKMTVFENAYKYGNMIILKNIDFQAFCSHHLLPFYGKVAVGYIPNEEKVIGASKLGRIVRKYAYKPQVQEKMTEEIADEIMRETQAKGVMVVVKAKHLCMIMRGLNDSGVEMITSSIRGVFEKLEVREEFLKLIEE